MYAIRSYYEKLAGYYSGMGLETKAENILITTGAQQALDLISRVYFRHGTVVRNNFV